jgi:hypothetical protein
VACICFESLWLCLTGVLQPDHVGAEEAGVDHQAPELQRRRHQHHGRDGPGKSCLKDYQAEARPRSVQRHRACYQKRCELGSILSRGNDECDDDDDDDDGVVGASGRGGGGAGHLRAVLLHVRSHQAQGRARDKEQHRPRRQLLVFLLPNGQSGGSHVPLSLEGFPKIVYNLYVIGGVKIKGIETSRQSRI